MATRHDVCAVCWDYRDRWRGELSELWVRAATALAPGGRSGLDVKVRLSRPGSGMPLREGPLTAMADALQRIEMWAAILVARGNPGSIPHGHARDGFVFARCLLLLTLYDHTLAGGPLAGDYYCDLYQAYWRLFRVDRHGVELVRMASRCPQCQRLSVWERHAGEYVTCLTCGSTWSQAGFLAIDRQPSS